MKIQNGDYISDDEYYVDDNYSIIERVTDKQEFKLIDNEKSWGSSYMGMLGDVDYDAIVAQFGKPNVESDDLKVDAEWRIQFDDGSIATIYNYKTGKNYLGDEGNEVENIRSWHIGGFDIGVVARVHKLFEGGL